MNNKKSHFWIPENEVERIHHQRRGRNEPGDAIFSEHGQKLRSDLESIEKGIIENESENSLSDTVVFKVELMDNEKVQAKPELFERNGLSVNVVKNITTAVVSANKQSFNILKNKIERYSQDSSNKTHFDFIKNFDTYTGTEKDASSLKKEVYMKTPPEFIDVQFMLLPNLENYEEIESKVIQKIKQNQGEIKGDTYYLSDNTPIIRAIIPPQTLKFYEKDSAIYRIEKTDFFEGGKGSIESDSLFTGGLDETIDIDDLPVVAVLDTGISLPENMKSLVIDEWIPSDSTGGDSLHGTMVASKVLFSNLGQQLSNPNSKLVPRAKVIDCNILDGPVSTEVFIARIQEAVARFKGKTTIFSLSSNSSESIEGDEMSITGYELDVLQLKEKVQLIISAGNHSLYMVSSSIDEIIDDDDARISPPADSMLSIVVGSVVGNTHSGSISQKDEIAPYSRHGPGHAGVLKPDICVYCGTILSDGVIPEDLYSIHLSKNGEYAHEVGTSFAAPVVAGDLSEIMNILPEKNVTLAKALLYHNAMPLWDIDVCDDEDLAYYHKIYGRGLPSLDYSKYSSPSRVTFFRTGTLNNTTKERIKILMPELLASQPGRGIARVTVTCVTMPPTDRNKGTEYLKAYVRASLKKRNKNEDLASVNPGIKEGRKKWDVCQHFSKPFSEFSAGDWEIWLELFSRWGAGEVDVEYALIVTIEDMSSKLDIYSEIENSNRYRPISQVRLDTQHTSRSE